MDYLNPYHVGIGIACIIAFLFLRLAIGERSRSLYRRR